MLEEDKNKSVFLEESFDDLQILHELEKKVINNKKEINNKRNFYNSNINNNYDSIIKPINNFRFSTLDVNYSSRIKKKKNQIFKINKSSYQNMKNNNFKLKEKFDDIYFQIERKSSKKNNVFENLKMKNTKSDTIMSSNFPLKEFKINKYKIPFSKKNDSKIFNNNNKDIFKSQLFRKFL
jgi:hypothetical protein